MEAVSGGVMDVEFLERVTEGPLNPGYITVLAWFTISNLFSVSIYVDLLVVLTCSYLCILVCVGMGFEYLTLIECFGIIDKYFPPVSRTFWIWYHVSLCILDLWLYCGQHTDLSVTKYLHWNCGGSFPGITEICLYLWFLASKVAGIYFLLITFIIYTVVAYVKIPVLCIINIVVM